MTRRQILTRQQIFEIGNELQEVLQPDPKHEGFFMFKDDKVDDDALAKKHGVSKFQVQNLRRELIGEVKRRTSFVTPMERMKDKMTALEERVTALEDQLTRPRLDIGAGTLGVPSHHRPNGA